MTALFDTTYSESVSDWSLTDKPDPLRAQLPYSSIKGITLTISNLNNNSSEEALFVI